MGYAVGAIFDLAKGMLPVALLGLLARRAFGTAVLLGIAWMCLVAYSCLATHATVSTAISGIERTGTWKMEVRGNAKSELASVEQQLAVLSRPAPPRPAKTVREALAGERVPPGIWKDSQECAASRKASTSPGRAPRSCSCAASWRRPRTTSGCPRVPASCARVWQLLPSLPPRTRFLRRSAPPWAACCQSGARKAWRSCSRWSSRSSAALASRA